MALITPFLCLLLAVASVFIINKYFSYKAKKISFIFTIVTINLTILLITDVILPRDIYYSTLINNENPSSNNNNNNTALTLQTISLKIDSDSNNETFTLIQSIFHIIWLLIYWSQFIICWFIIPISISFFSLNYAFDNNNNFKEKLITAIMENIKFYAICLIGIVIGLIYLIASTKHSITEFKSLLISLSHLYSLSYALILLSTGLVLVPRDLLNWINDKINNDSLYIKLSKQNDDLNESYLNMLDQSNKILFSDELRNGDISFNQLLNNCQSEINYKLKNLDLTQSSNNINITTDNNNNNTSSTQEKITNLNDLNKTYNKFITNYYNYKYYQFQSDLIIHKLATTNNNSPFYRLTRISIIFLGIITTILSAIIILMEILPIRFFSQKIIFSQSNSNDFNYWLILIILSYNTISSLYAMSKFKFNNFHLIPNGESNPINVLYYSLYSSRLLFPLCFNLITILPETLNHDRDTRNDINGSANSIFEYTLYRNLKIIPLVNFLNNYLPIIFMILIPLSFKFDIKQKILIKLFGEEFYYQFFGMMLYEPDLIDPLDNTINNITNTNLDTINSNSDNFSSRTNNRLNEDYEYSLQDGRYLFERASNVNNNRTRNNNNNQFPKYTDNDIEIGLSDNTDVNNNNNDNTNSNDNNISSTPNTSDINNYFSYL